MNDRSALHINVDPEDSLEFELLPCRAIDLDESEGPIAMELRGCSGSVWI